jgi:phosphomannomutase
VRPRRFPQFCAIDFPLNSNQERDDFEKFDETAKVRTKMIDALKEKFGDLNLTYSIGGQISFDVFPQGWDKTYCLRARIIIGLCTSLTLDFGLQHVEKEGFKEIHFFGDKYVVKRL